MYEWRLFVWLGVGKWRGRRDEVGWRRRWCFRRCLGSDEQLYKSCLLLRLERRRWGEWVSQCSRLLRFLVCLGRGAGGRTFVCSALGVGACC